MSFLSKNEVISETRAMASWWSWGFCQQSKEVMDETSSLRWCGWKQDSSVGSVRSPTEMQYSHQRPPTETLSLVGSLAVNLLLARWSKPAEGAGHPLPPPIRQSAWRGAPAGSTCASARAPPGLWLPYDVASISEPRQFRLPDPTFSLPVPAVGQQPKRPLSKLVGILPYGRASSSLTTKHKYRLVVMNEYRWRLWVI